MNTIYDGSFLLGETSGLTFQAGPGIQITQPSEGTVRIANDETVLWSGNVIVSTAQNVLNLSESLNNFQTFRIYDKSVDRLNVGTRVTEFISVSSEIYFGTEDAWVDSWKPTTEGCCYIGHNYYSANNNRDEIATLRSFYKSLPTTAAEVTQNLGRVYKIVGINRINGGNA